METFVVRVWTSADVTRPTGNGGGATLRGRVEHVQSGLGQAFHATDQLLEFMQRAGRASDSGLPWRSLADGTGAAGTEKPKGAER